MCFGGGGGGGAPDTRLQEQSLQLQREQMLLQEAQMARQQAQYEEQMRITNAPPPPAPSKTAEVAAPALENAAAVSPSQIRQGMGRRKMRTDTAGAMAGGLNIPQP